MADLVRALFRWPILVPALLLALTGAVAVAAPASEPATLYILSREIVTMRGMVADTTPARRVEQTRARLLGLPKSAIDLPLAEVAADFGESRGVQFFLSTSSFFLRFCMTMPTLRRGSASTRRSSRPGSVSRRRALPGTS